MAVPIIFPFRQGSTKESIIHIFLEKDNLSLKKIHNHLKLRYGISRKYQSIRQAVLELVDQGVLIKTGRIYSISSEWILGMDNFISLLKRKYVNDLDVQIIDKNTTEIKNPNRSKLRGIF